MKKILACVLALSFCTATVEASFFGKIKSGATKLKSAATNKIKSGATKIKTTLTGKDTATTTNKADDSLKTEIENWLTNLKELISEVIPYAEEISKGATGSTQTSVNGLKLVLKDCKTNPFKIVGSTDGLDVYIKEIKKGLGKENKDFKNLSASYDKVKEVIDAYSKNYDSNLESMNTAIKGIKEGWSSDGAITNTANGLKTELAAYENPIKVISDAESTKINNLISTLSSRIGSEHEYIKALTDGVAYLKNHAKYKEQSDEMAQPFLKKVNNKVKNVSEGISNIKRGVDSVTNRLNSVENTSINIDSLKNNNSIIKSAIMND